MTAERKVIPAGLGLLELAKQLGSVSQACKAMGYSRDSSAASTRPARRWATAGTDSVLAVKGCMPSPAAEESAGMLAPVKDAARLAARWPLAILDLRCACRRAGRRIGTAG